ncbi:MAG TPA: DUF2723 domain-containing protein, partial [Acidobacteriota bacterium]
ILLNHVFTGIFPFGSLAYKANLLSAIFSLAALLFLFRILLLLSIRPITAAITVLTFAFTQSAWFISLFAEVYSLHLLFASAVLYYFMKWHFHRRDRDLMAGCAAYAFSFGNHLTMLALLPAIFLLVWVTDRSVFRNIRKIAAIVAVILLGAMQYGYLFWRYYDPDTRYIEMSTPDLKSLWWYITGAQFKSLLFPYSFGTFVSERLPAAALAVYTQFSFFVLIALLGALRFANRSIQLFLLVALIVYTLFILNMRVYAVHYYLAVTYFILAIYLAKGLSLVRPPRLQWVFVLIPAAFLLANFNQVDQSGNTTMSTQVEHVLQKAGRRALILSPHYDASESFWYYLIGENKEKDDIFLLHHFVAEQVRAYIRGRAPLYLPEERKHVPAGLTVYGISATHRMQLQAAGLRIEQLDALLYKVR